MKFVTILSVVSVLLAMTLKSSISQKHQGMVLVPAQEFMMGSTDNDARSDEKPVHRVRLDAFGLMKHRLPTNSLNSLLIKRAM